MSGKGPIYDAIQREQEFRRYGWLAPEVTGVYCPIDGSSVTVYVHGVHVTFTPTEARLFADQIRRAALFKPSEKQMFEWTIEFEIMPVGGKVGDERSVMLISEASNAPDALMAAITCVRQTMLRGEGFHEIHVGRAVPTDSDPMMQMPVARIV